MTTFSWSSLEFAVAVGAFRVVVKLDMKRRDNDKKIGVLLMEMRDMMEALLQYGVDLSIIKLC